jgi:hypothetical protein
MRWRVFAGIAVLILGFAMNAPARAQIGYDRWGSDYASFPVRSGDPALCAARCERDSRCRAWSFAYPTVVGANAVCWLKSRIPRRTKNSCCASGVRGTGVIEPRARAIEYSVDRTGGDYRSFELPSDPTGRSCQAACRADPKCRAWTYLRPGYGGPASRCFLKERVTPPRKRPCCISGVVR